MSSHLVLNNTAQVSAGMDLAQSARFLRAGGVLIFPTETFYGMGCLAAHADAVARCTSSSTAPSTVFRPCWRQVPHRWTKWPNWRPCPRAFWPGPLTVLLPARAGFAAGACKCRGAAALRVTPHPLAAQLAVEAGGPPLASSANLSGGEAVRSPQQLDPALLDALQSAAKEMSSVSSDAHMHNHQPLLLGGPCPPGGCLRQWLSRWAL